MFSSGVPLFTVTSQFITLQLSKIMSYKINMIQLDNKIKSVCCGELSSWGLQFLLPGILVVTLLSQNFSKTAKFVVFFSIS